MSGRATTGECPSCGKKGLLLPLHLERGGPIMCIQCGTAWHAKHTRRRKFGRIVMKAMNLYLENGGRFQDLNKFKESLALATFGVKLPGFEADSIGTDVGDLTSELLADILQLVHPDRHPPERKELATRVTADLNELRPFVFPAPKPKPVPQPKERNGSLQSQPATTEKPLQPTFPCDLCVEMVPLHYCDPCRAQWERRREEEREIQRKRRRRQYQRRKQRLAWMTPSVACPACGERFKPPRKDARFCSNACRQREHRRLRGVTGFAPVARSALEAVTGAAGR